MSGGSLTIRQVTECDLDPCYAIEKASYGSEGATRERIGKRIEIYSQGFLVAELDGQVIGFVNSGSTNKEDISEEEFKDMVEHESEGENIVIFSLAVAPEHRGRGISRQLMERFIDGSKGMGKSRILLLCQPGLVPYYEKYGFIDGGESKSRHGGLRWHEMYLPLAD